MLYQIVIADFKERTRRYSFLITLGFVLFFGYLVNTGKYAINFGQYRGVYNSAWIGSLMAMGTSMMICFAGFYLIKNCLKRDEETRVGEILASTPMTDSFYLFAKFISNLFTLWVMVFILIAAAVVMQLLGNSSESVNLWALIAPFLFTTLPAVVMVSALALLFETVPFLRGTKGNVIYFFMSEALLVAGAFGGLPVLDIIGAGTFLPSMEAAALAAFPGAKLGLQMGFVGFVKEASQDMKLFTWQGVEWNLAVIIPKVILIGLALGILYYCTRLFNREAARASIKPKSRKLSAKISRRTKENDEAIVNIPQLKVKELTPATIQFKFLNMMKAELWLMLKGSQWVWYLMAFIFVVLQLVLPYSYALSIALPAAWIWPLLKWSGMGTREKRFNTMQLLLSSPSPIKRQLPATWCAGLMVTLTTGSGLIIRAIIMQDFSMLYALLTAAAFIPSVALFLGTTAGSQKPFEVIYMILWYLGPINRVGIFDFTGVTNQTIHTPVYLIITLILLSLTLFIRSRN